MKQSFRITLREFKRFKGTIKGVRFPPALTSGHSLPSAPRVSGFIAHSSSYRGDACRGQARCKHFVQQFEIKTQGKVRLWNDLLCVLTAVKMLFVSLPVWGHGANEDLPFLVVAALVLGQDSPVPAVRPLQGWKGPRPLLGQGQLPAEGADSSLNSQKGARIGVGEQGRGSKGGLKTPPAF